MRHLFAVSLALAAGAVGGCLPDVRQPGVPVETALRRAQRAADEDTIFVDFALIERPADDAYCSRDLWEGCNEQCVGLERAALLEENGLHVARIAAPIPARLQTLLNSRRSTIGPRRQKARDDMPVAIAVGPRRPKSAFALRGGEGREFDLADAQAQFEVVPRLVDGRLVLRVTPQVRHGEAKARPCVEETPDGPLRWALETREPVEELSELSVEMPMEPGEYLVIGARGDDPRAVGPAFFAYRGDGVPVRQLLIVRALPVGKGDDADEVDQKSAPLALQATYTSARGHR
jgi:hypothetical protein